MNLAATLLLALSGPDGVAIGADGLRLDGVALDSAQLQVRRFGGTTLLASSSSVEPLSAALTVAVDAKGSLLLQPGLRLTRVKDGYVLEAHGRRRVALEVDGLPHDFESGVLLKGSADGLDVGSGRAQLSGLIRARVLSTEPTPSARAQEGAADPDADLKAMSQAAQRFLEARRRSEEKAALVLGRPIRRSAGENFFAVSAVLNSFRQLRRLSPLGF